MGGSNIDVMTILVHCICCGVIIIFLYVIFSCIKKYNLTHWVVKAVNAADKMFEGPPGTDEKREWVFMFLKSNGLVSGVSSATINKMIDAAVKSVTEMSNKNLSKKS